MRQPEQMSGTATKGKCAKATNATQVQEQLEFAQFCSLFTVKRTSASTQWHAPNFATPVLHAQRRIYVQTKRIGKEIVASFEMMYIFGSTLQKRIFTLLSQCQSTSNEQKLVSDKTPIWKSDWDLSDIRSPGPKAQLRQVMYTMSNRSFLPAVQHELVSKSKDELQPRIKPCLGVKQGAKQILSQKLA